MHSTLIRSLAVVALGLGSGGLPVTAQAATPSEYCTGYVTSLPATISTQGIWCLSGDLATSITAGAAITLASNNITLDCNGYKLGGLGGGPETLATGITASGRSNLTVRNCSVRGFRIGVLLQTIAGSGGHVIEDNRFEGQTSLAIGFGGDGNLVQRNQVLDIGRPTEEQNAFGILASGSADILDNSFSGLSVTTGQFAYGIYVTEGTSFAIRGNRIRNLVGVAFGIYLDSIARASVRDNELFGPGSVGVGIACNSTQSVASGNYVGGFATETAGCTNVGNLVPP